jgi:hypothetical protein
LLLSVEEMDAVAKKKAAAVQLKNGRKRQFETRREALRSWKRLD